VPAHDTSGSAIALDADVFRALRIPIPLSELLKRTFNEILADNCLGMAAQLAFYFVLALFPALVFAVALASYFPYDVLARAVEALAPVAPPEVVSLMKKQIAALTASESGGLLTIGVLGALWSSSAAMLAMIDTLNRAYDIEEGRPWWKVRLLGIALTTGLAFFILIAFTLVIAGPELARTVAAQIGLGRAFEVTWLVLQWPFVFALVTLGIAIVYYVAPDAEQEWVWITPGSVLATVLWLLVSLGFRYYVSSFGDYNATYGTLAGAVVLLLWLYLSGLAILVGGEINAEIEHASPLGKNPGEKKPGARRRLMAFAKSRRDRGGWHTDAQPSAGRSS
jgi:membrane protein